MLDARGAILKGPYHARFVITHAGFIADSWYEQLPGACKSDSGQWLLPHNSVPYDVPTTSFDPRTPSGLEFRQYQIDAIKFALARPRGALIALDVGLGKTMSTLHVASVKNLFPFVVVAPKLASETWCADDSDAWEHYHIKVHQLRGTNPSQETYEKYVKRAADSQEPYGLFLNPEILSAWGPWLTQHVQPKMVIYDEAHTFRNPTKRSIAAMEFSGGSSIKHRLMLTATPVVRSVADLWMLANFCEPGGWGKRAEFGVRYENWTRGEYGWNAGQESNVEELRARLSRVMFHRSRFDVRDDLPPMSRTPVWFSKDALETEAWKLYKRAETDIVAVIREKEGNLAGRDLQRYTTLARTISTAKVPCACDVIDDMLTTNKKVVVLTWYKATAWAIYKALSTRQGQHAPALHGPVDSDTRTRKRDAFIQSFHDSEPDENGAVFIATLGTTGMSMNKLACASGMYINDVHWLPTTLLQAEGRLHREGQQAELVDIRYGLVKKSMDNAMYALLEERADLAKKLADDPAGVTLATELGGIDDKDEAPLKSLLLELAELASDEEWEL